MCGRCAGVASLSALRGLDEAPPRPQAAPLTRWPPFLGPCLLGWPFLPFPLSTSRRGPTLLTARGSHGSEALPGRVAVVPPGPQPGQCPPRLPGLSWKGSALFLQVPLHDRGQDPPPLYKQGAEPPSRLGGGRKEFGIQRPLTHPGAILPASGTCPSVPHLQVLVTSCLSDTHGTVWVTRGFPALTGPPEGEPRGCPDLDSGFQRWVSEFSGTEATGGPPRPPRRPARLPYTG